MHTGRPRVTSFEQAPGTARHFEVRLPALLAYALLFLSLLAGCAGKNRMPDSPAPAPAPPMPPPQEQPRPVSRPGSGTPTQPGVISRQTLKQWIVRDTLAASRKLRQCGGKDVLPDQEFVMEGVLHMLADTRRALLQNNLTHARACSRSALQLSKALDCQ